ncbi:MAG: amino-acid N-acetyltransferase, partial [Gammaproteobacteria bacterium]
MGNTPMSNADVRVTSGNFVAAKPLGIIDGVDYLYTGEVRGIDTDSIRAKLDAHEIVLIPPLGYSVTGETFNLGAGALAAKLAVALQADKLIYLMEGGSLKDGEGELVSQMTQLQAEAQLKTMTEGEGADYYYLRHAVDASAGGVDRVHLIERNIEGAILQELFTRDGVGTMISGVAYDVIRKAEVGDIAGILELIVPLEKQGILVARSREKLELEIEHFTVMLRDGVIVGTGALYPFAGEAAAELACLAVHPDYHNHGRGEE